MDSLKLEPRDSWAVLVGIDWYSDDEEGNLEGCVNDVERTKNMLRTNLQIPPEHITTLLSANASDINDQYRPTKTNVIQAIEDVAQRAKAGDLFYFHYSGHGDRVPTKYAHLKTGTNKDEVLCTLEEDITDVEFGELLDKLQEQYKLVVCAVLDCCHSGGADRYKTHGVEERRVRCRKQKPSAGSSNGRGPGNKSSRGAKSRNAVPKKSWFYRTRNYNLIAAAQPHEKAREYKDDDGKIYGRMTYHLVQTLARLQTSTEPVTYGLLQDVLEASCKAVSRKSGRRQQPMHLGDRDRAIFTTTSLDLGQCSFIAGITFIDKVNRTVKLNRGAASSVRKGDKFQIYGPSNSFFGAVITNNPPVAEVMVKEVRGLESVAVLCSSSPTSLEGVDVGFLAKLSERAKPARVFIDTTGEQPHIAIDRLRKEWPSYVDSEFPLELEFNSPAGDIDMVVEVDEESFFHFRDGRGEEMSHVPPLRSDRPESSKELMKLLKHLCSYQLVANLANPPSPSLPKFEFKVEEAPRNETDQETYSSWRVQFTNNHSSILYVTILNLTPVYGVQQIFPSYTQFASSRAVDRDKGIPELTFDIVVPPPLKRVVGPGFRMRDTIKVLVSTEQTNFCNYLLPDLGNPDSSSQSEDTPSETADDDPDDDSDDAQDHGSDEERSDDPDSGDSEAEDGPGRTAKVRGKTAVASWFVVEHVIPMEIA
ncbi:caspase domain-containing protein [Biscogniauxia marginata]|nr:caspase domain-containing protein [Biscogniauxia marginata]